MLTHVYGIEPEAIVVESFFELVVSSKWLIHNEPVFKSRSANQQLSQSN